SACSGEVDTGSPTRTCATQEVRACPDSEGTGHALRCPKPLVDELLVEHGREASVEFSDRFLDLGTLDEVTQPQEEDQPFLAAREGVAAVSLDDVERDPSSRRIRDAAEEQSLVVVVLIPTAKHRVKWRRRRIIGHGAAPAIRPGSTSNKAIPRPNLSPHQRV